MLGKEKWLKELRASVERGRNDIVAGRCCSHAEAMRRIRLSLREKYA